jgi:uncharacterized OsmC-like protein
MSQSETIKTAVERSTKALSLKPSLGLGTGISKTKIKNGLLCETHEGKWSFLVDMPESSGGTGLAPTPGVYGRAALGSCLAITYMIKAAQMDIEVSSLEVEVQADYNHNGLFGTADVPPGYSEVRYKVSIESEAAEENILRMLDDADKHSPYLFIFAGNQPCRREVTITSPKPQI